MNNLARIDHAETHSLRASELHSTSEESPIQTGQARVMPIMEKNNQQQKPEPTFLQKLIWPTFVGIMIIYVAAAVIGYIVQSVNAQ